MNLNWSTGGCFLVLASQGDLICLMYRIGKRLPRTWDGTPNADCLVCCLAAPNRTPLPNQPLPLFLLFPGLKYEKEPQHKRVQERGVVVYRSPSSWLYSTPHFLFHSVALLHFESKEKKKEQCRQAGREQVVLPVFCGHPHGLVIYQWMCNTHSKQEIWQWVIRLKL